MSTRLTADAPFGTDLDLVDLDCLQNVLENEDESICDDSGKGLKKKTDFEAQFSVYRHLGDFSLEREPVRGSATWEKCHLKDFNLFDFLGTISILYNLFLQKK